MDAYKMRSELSNGRTIYELPMRVTFYVAGAEGRQPLKNLIEQYEEFVRSSPRWVHVEGYIDGVEGAAGGKNEAFNKMVTDAKNGRFDFIVTKELSRFARNTTESIRYARELLEAGVGVLFEADNINTFMPDGELKLTVMHGFARDEARKHSERVKSGLRRASEKGLLGSTIWGYKKDKGRLEIDEKQAEIVRLIYKLYAEDNMGMRAIRRQLNKKGYVNSKGNEFSFSTLKGIITNPKYMGHYKGGRDESIPPIVTEEIWHRANAILRERAEKKAQNAGCQNKYTYSGKIFCGRHGSPFYRINFRYKSGDKEAWQCREYAARGRSSCTAPVVYTHEIDRVIKDAHEIIIVNRAEIANDLQAYYGAGGVSKIRDEIARINKEMVDIGKRKDQLLDLNIGGYISKGELAKRNHELNKETERYEARVAELIREEEKNRSLAHTVDNLRKIIASESFADDTGEVSNDMVDFMIERVIVLESEEKNTINLQVFFKVIGDRIDYTIRRTGRKTGAVITGRHERPPFDGEAVGGI